MSALTIFGPDDPLVRLYQRAIDKAMGGKPDNPAKRQRYYVMAQLLRAALQHRGNVAEFGCWRGHSTLVLASIMTNPADQRELHVFDSFEGLSPFRSEDKAPRKPEDANRAKYATSVDAFRAMVAPLGFVTVHKGWIPEVLEETGPLCFANIDVNLYEPTLYALHFAVERLVPGGIAFLDDYGYATCPGATKAVDAVVRAHPEVSLVAMPFGSAFLIRQAA